MRNTQNYSKNLNEVIWDKIKQTLELSLGFSFSILFLALLIFSKSQEGNTWGILIMYKWGFKSQSKKWMLFRCRFVTNTSQSKVFKVFFSFCWIVLKSSHWAHLDPLKAQTFHLSVRSECYFMYIVCIEQCEGHGYLVSGRILILTSPCMQLGERICSHLLHIPFH